MRDVERLRIKAQTLRALHRPGQPLVLANVWDCASARIVEEAGAPAVATTSAGIAFAYGYPDGEKIPTATMLEAVARICGCVAVPVTADLEAGYGDTAEALERLIGEMLDAGAVGLNLEDHVGERESPLVDLRLQVSKIRAVRRAAERLGVRVVLNARTDSYLRGLGSTDEMFDETLRRGLAYREAGADCVFVPGLADPAAIGDVVRRLGCPVNILAGAGSPPIPQLARLGVARVSLGSGPMRATLTLLRKLAEELSTRGTFTALEGIVPHASVNALMGPSRLP